MSKTLYILGNGFDQYHGLPTSYRCFLCYMLREHPDEVEKLGFIFDRKDPYKLWSDFETQLENIDALDLVVRNIEQWKMMDKKQFDNMFYNIHELLQEYFKEWVEQINMKLYNEKKLSLDSEALFLTFNYSNLLERVYQIPHDKICYLHGETMNNPNCNPVVGHARQNNCIEKQKCEICIYICHRNIYSEWAKSPEEFARCIIEQLNELWEGLAKQPSLLHRPLDAISNYYIAQHSEFNNYVGLSDIYVLGHSLSIVDKDYFEYIYKLSPNANWHLSIQKPDESIAKGKSLGRLLGIAPELLKYDTLIMDSLLV